MIFQLDEMPKLKLLAVVAVFFISFSIACSGDQQKTQNKAPEKHSNSNESVNGQTSVDQSKAISGKELFAMNCMICHKENGKGGPVSIAGKQRNADDLTTQKMKDKTDDRLLAYVRDGVVDEGMPAFKDKLTEDEMKTVVAYVRELQGK